MIEIRYAIAEDVVPLVANLRKRDRAALEALGRPAEALVLDSMQLDVFTCTALYDGDPAVMWGARSPSVFDDRAYIWMLGTTLVDEHPLLFLRYSRRAIRHLTSHFARLYGDIECDFEASAKWLGWLGARIEPVNNVLRFVL